jgi:hypothetical protein
MQNEPQKTDKKTKIFYTIFFVLILISVAVTFYRYVILKDYQIVAEVSCDPTEEICYFYEGVVCDDPIDTECVPEEAYDYKIISKNAANIYACEQTDEKIDCGEELSCLEGEENCEYTYCDSENLEEWEVCSEPVEEDIDILLDGSNSDEVIIDDTEAILELN